jgi:catechol 2,3-dioxygenase-like lactoylglutathione lyase family enzyme
MSTQSKPIKPACSRIASASRPLFAITTIGRNHFAEALGIDRMCGFVEDYQMDRFILNMLKEFESGKMSRRQLIQTLAVAATVYAAGADIADAQTAAPKTLGFHTTAVNHVSYDVSGTGVTWTEARDWYVKVFGMDYTPEHDNGAEAFLPFGPRDAGTFWLTRGGARDVNAPPAAPRGGGGGRGAAAPGAPAAAPPARPPVTARIDEVGLTIDHWDTKEIAAGLKRFNVDSKADGESLHIVDPFGMELHLMSPKMSTY